jgi:hypothetical protein
MRREWEPEELIAAWTLLDGYWELVSNKTGRDAAGLQPDPEGLRGGGAVPAALWRDPKAAVDYVAGQVKVDPELFAEHKRTGSTVEYHRKQIREALGFRESTRADEDALIVCPRGAGAGGRTILRHAN